MNEQNNLETGQISDIFCSDKDKILAKVSYAGDVAFEIFDLNTRDSVRINTDLNISSGEIWIVDCFWRENTLSILLSDNQIYTFYVDTGECISILKCNVPAIYSGCACDDNSFAVLCSDAVVRRIDSTSGNIIASVSIKQKDITISETGCNIDYDADNNYLIVETSRRIADIIDIDTFEIRYHLTNYADYNAKTNTVALNEYNVAGICPLYDTNQLIQKAKRYIGYEN